MIFAIPEQICAMENIAVFNVLITASREITVIQIVPTLPYSSEPYRICGTVLTPSSSHGV